MAARPLFVGANGVRPLAEYQMDSRFRGNDRTRRPLALDEDGIPAARLLP